MNIYPLLYNFQGILVTNRKGKSRDGPTGGGQGGPGPPSPKKKKGKKKKGPPSPK